MGDVGDVRKTDTSSKTDDAKEGLDETPSGVITPAPSGLRTHETTIPTVSKVR